MKPLGYKSYGSIPHLIGSRLGPGDHHASVGQVKIATEKTRDKHDIVIVQEKLDGGNVGVTKLNGEILAITRAGYLANTSQYKTHHVFNEYVRVNRDRFYELLKEGERVCGEWLFTAVGTKYDLPHEPFVPFDLMTGKKRLIYYDFVGRVMEVGFQVPRILGVGPCSISAVESLLQRGSQHLHGNIDPVEGAVWRVERKGEVDFLCKYVRPNKIDGAYLQTDHINGMTSDFDYLIDFYKSL